MVNIDMVYQRVLAFANKEQRGYITPQEFNLFANQAQLEIFEQYFYDLNQASRIHGNDTIYADVDDMLEEKIQIFEATNTTYVASDIYRLHSIRYEGASCEILRKLDFNDAKSGGPLTAPSDARPVANVSGGVLSVIGSNNASLTPDEISYVKKPAKAVWDYFVVNDKALYSVTTSIDFELHPSEESELVYKILKFAGVSMARLDLMRAGQIQEQSQQQQEKQ
tara:strand:+ start:13 stop:681 length:669 start_codon:yes stop_codon:yes gene_type:complete